MSGGTFVTAFGLRFDSVYTGKLVSRDGRIGLDRLYWMPQDQPGHNDYMVVHTKVYSIDGQAHQHVTLGSVIDWDVPSEEPSINTSSTAATEFDVFEYLYIQGSDTTGTLSCQPSTKRIAAEVYLGWVVDTPNGWDSDPCDIRPGNGRVWAGPQGLLADTNLARDGSPLDPPQLDGRAWWNEIDSHPGLHPESAPGNQAVWLTYIHDYDLAVDDTLHFWSLLTTVRDGTPADLNHRIRWTAYWVRETLMGCGCSGEAACIGRVGNVNGNYPEEPTISDVAALVNMLFISTWFPPSLMEADINASGACQIHLEDITIGDLAVLVDYLFITGSSAGLYECSEMRWFW